MPYNYFAPKPGRLGALPNILTSGRMNTGTLAAGTQTHTIGTHPAKCYINRATVSAATYPTAATSCVVRLIKYDSVANAAVTLTSNLDINDKTDRESLALAITDTLTDAQRTLLAGDTLEVEIVTVGAVSVQPDDVVCVVELLVEE
jgi:hypothetical protein